MKKLIVGTFLLAMTSAPTIAGNMFKSSGLTINSEKECASVIRGGELKKGGAGYPFAGNYGTKGCYYYSSGKYKGRAYWGKGGSKSARKKIPATKGKHRVTYYWADGIMTCAFYKTRGVTGRRLLKVRQEGRCRHK